MRSVHTLAVLASISGLALCAAVQAATISYLGEDAATQANWRTASTAKPVAFNPSGTNVYGSDGYYVLTSSGWDDWNDQVPNGARIRTQISLPAYIGGVSPLLVGGTHAGTVFGAAQNPVTGAPIGGFNDPSALSQPTNVGSGEWYQRSLVGPTAGVFVITLNAKADFILGFIGNPKGWWGNGAAPSSLQLQLQQTAGVGNADTGMVAVNGNSAAQRNPVYNFFSISGEAGDQFTVSAPVVGGSVFAAGMTFDSASVPEPVSVALLGLCPLMLLSRKRQR